MLEHLLAAWPRIGQRLSSAGHVLLLSDYDGTLTPIVERPELADLPPTTRRLLGDLARQRRYTVGIISGRALSDLKARVGVKNVTYAGNHGLEIEGPSLTFVHPIAREIKDVIRALYVVLRRGLEGIRGAMVEHKGLTLSVHYRLVDQTSVPNVKNTFEEAVGVAREAGQVRTTQGKKVYEVRPAVDWNKGRAVGLILEHFRDSHRKAHPAVLFLGDDVTDEDGFRVVVDLGGIAIYVGEEPRETLAQYCLGSPAEVQEFLARLVDAEKRRTDWMP